MSLQSSIQTKFTQTIASNSIEHLRSILVKTLPKENVSSSDRIKVRKFQEKEPRTKFSVDKELRLKHLKEKQNEERQKKMEEIKAQEMAAQKIKEEIEEGRRKRLEELKYREEARRQQVEERKRAINEAERDRLEFILKRNQEREARIESKKRNERSNIVFAFGSSTPRMLDPNDHQATFWGHRRATSTQNITSMTTSLTRRQSERDLDSGSKKRATSASGLERSGESSTPVTPAGCISGYMGRRRTDLMPTIPSRDTHYSTPRKSLSQSPASSRPSSALSQQSTTSISSSVSMRHRPISARKPRPASIAVTGITSELKNLNLDSKKNDVKPPIPKTRKPINKAPPSTDRTSRSKASSCEGTPKSIQSPTNPSNPIVANKVLTSEGTKPVQKPVEIMSKQEEKIPVENKDIEANNDTVVATINPSQEIVSIKGEQVCEVKIPEVNQAISEKSNVENQAENKISDTVKMNKVETKVVKVEPEQTSEPQILSSENISDLEKETLKVVPSKEDSDMVSSKDANEMSASMSKPRITTEEEAKAALAERRRLAREEAERQAEQERLRIEREAREEFERQQREEEAQRKLIELQRKAEEERLQEAIREAQKREEEEKLKREEEQRQRQLKEEAEKKAREESERQKAELQERLKNEEKEREARRKRVEAIMLRTRGKNANMQSQDSQNSEDKNENNKNENKSENQVNGTKSLDKENGTTKNGKDIEIVDNIRIPDESVKNANNVSLGTINSTDSINSNNSWQTTQQYGNFVCNNNS